MLEVQIYKKLAEFDLDVSFQVNDNILGGHGCQTYILAERCDRSTTEKTREGTYEAIATYS